MICSNVFPMGAVETYRIPTERRKGRAASGNPAVRFEARHREVVDDGWDLETVLPPLRTEISIKRPRRVINADTSPGLGFERSINPYRGCEHGCIYCYARPSHAYLGLSPGLDFETRLIARPEAPKVLETELSAERYRPEVITMGTDTDPYQPIEREHRITRQILREFRHPVGIVTN